MLTLQCEICGKTFPAKRNRPFVHCRECAERLRAEGKGPIQQRANRTEEHKTGYQELDWSMSDINLLYYIHRFRRYPVYDRVIPQDIDTITDEDRRLANKIAARMGKKVWEPLIGKSIIEIGQWNLLSMSDAEWEAHKHLISKVLGELLSYSGIGVARLTKALHRKRPTLIPICDSIVCDALLVSTDNKPNRLIECMTKLRRIGRENTDTLRDLQKVSRNNRVALGKLRILESLYWVQFGPFSPYLNSGH